MPREANVGKWIPYSSRSILLLLCKRIRVALIEGDTYVHHRARLVRRLLPDSEIHIPPANRVHLSSKENHYPSPCKPWLSSYSLASALRYPVHVLLYRRNLNHPLAGPRPICLMRTVRVYIYTASMVFRPDLCTIFSRRTILYPLARYCTPLQAAQQRDLYAILSDYNAP